MPRPTDKATLLALGQTNFDKVFALIDSWDEATRHGEFQFEHRDRNVRDTLMHLHEWHRMMLRWHEEGMAGQKPAIPAEGYTWRTLPALNKKIWEAVQTFTLEEATTLLQTSHEQVREKINQYTDEELFEKKRYKWTGTTSLGAYFVSATSSHYDWALKQLKKHQRTFQS